MLQKRGTFDSFSESLKNIFHIKHQILTAANQWIQGEFRLDFLWGRENERREGSKKVNEGAVGVLD